MYEGAGRTGLLGPHPLESKGCDPLPVVLLCLQKHGVVLSVGVGKSVSFQESLSESLPNPYPVALSAAASAFDAVMFTGESSGFWTVVPLAKLAVGLVELSGALVVAVLEKETGVLEAAALLVVVLERETGVLEAAALLV